LKGGSEDPFATLFTGSITAKIGGSIMPIIDKEGPVQSGCFQEISILESISLSRSCSALENGKRGSGKSNQGSKESLYSDSLGEEI